MSEALANVAPLSTAHTHSLIYTRQHLDKELWQGEILSDVSVYFYDPIEDETIISTYPYVVVMCQDCDLEQEFRKRESGEDGELITILLFQAGEAATLRQRVPSTEISNRAKDNREERYHFIEAVPPELDSTGMGLPALCIDFKRFFALNPTELYRQLSADGGAARRTRLISPYKEHLQHRASAYAGRVGLPRPHSKN